MPKKSKRKDKNTGKPKSRASGNPEVGSDDSTSQRYDVRYRENPVKSDTDPNEYRVIELPNGLVALLISCPTGHSDQKGEEILCNLARLGETNLCPHLKQMMDRVVKQIKYPAVCCLCVNVGYFSDPRQVPGVSRVLGVALFSRLFQNGPEMSREFKQIIKQKEATEMAQNSEATIFCMSVTHRVYREAIKWLGHSLRSEAIPKHQTEMARQEVLRFDDKPEMSLTPQNEREHIFSQCVSKRHPAKTFGKDFLERLRQADDDKLYREVQKFRKRHYSAHRMTVVMKAELPLDTLETHAKECFSRITNNGLPPQLLHSYNFANSVENTKFRRIWRIDSADYDEMYVKWILPPSSWLYRTKSLEFLSLLFSYGGTGSLVSYLEMKQWATEVHGRLLDEPAWNTSLYSTFCVTVALTAIGNSKHKLDVLDAIYSYINFLRIKGPQKSIYDDYRTIRNAAFRYGQATLKVALDFAKLASNMHIYPSTDYLAAPFFWYEYDPVSLSTCLDLMTPTKACIVVTDGNFGEHPEIKLAGRGEGQQSTDIPEDWIVRWQTIEPLPGFKLPERNIFCPDDLRMIDAPAVISKYPVRVHSDSMSEVWYKFDPGLRAPTCQMIFCYVSPLPLESPENAAMLQFFSLVLEFFTDLNFYPASLAGLSWKIKPYFCGLGLKVSGYTQKLPLLTQVLAQFIPKSYHLLTKHIFETKKVELLDEYSEISDPNLAKEIRNSILTPGRCTVVEEHAALSLLQFERFQHFMKHFFDHVYIKCLVEGNIAEADAVKNALRVVEVSQCGPLPRNMIPEIRKNKIPRGNHCCTIKTLKLNSSDVIVENYYQFDDSSVELGGILHFLVWLQVDTVVADLLTFDFGTTAGSTYAIFNRDVNSYTIGFVDSGTSTIDAKRIASIDTRIEEELQITRDIVKNSIDNVWRLHKDKIIARMRKRVNRLASEFEHNWEAIVNGKYAFGKLSRQLDALHKMDSADFHKWIKYITDDSNIRKLSIRIVGDNYSRADFSTVETRPDKSNTGPNNIPLYRLQYLTEHAGQTGNTRYNCITDIYEFKKQLEVSSNTNVTS